MTQTQLEEFEALSYAGVPELPAPLKEGDPWAKAIAKVRTYTNRESYAIVKRNFAGENPIVVKVFSTGGLAKIESIHPYMMIDISYARCNTIAELDQLLARVYKKKVSEIKPLTMEQKTKLHQLYCLNLMENREASMKASEEKRIERGEMRRKKAELEESLKSGKEL